MGAWESRPEESRPLDPPEAQELIAALALQDRQEQQPPPEQQSLRLAALEAKNNVLLESDEDESPPDLQEKAHEPSVSVPDDTSTTSNVPPEQQSLRLAALETENADLRDENNGLQGENEVLRHQLDGLLADARVAVRETDRLKVAVQEPPFIVDFAQNGNALALALRLCAGADPNQQDHRGNACIMASSRHGRPECTRLLIAAGADVSVVHLELGNLLGMLMLSVGRNHEPYHKGDFVLTADLLIDAGAPVPVWNSQGRTVIGLLLEKQDEYGATGEDANKAEDCRALMALLTGEYWGNYGRRNPFLRCTAADEATWLLMTGAANTGQNGHVDMTRLRSIRPSIRFGVMAGLDQILIEHQVFVEILLTVAREHDGPSPFGLLFDDVSESLLESLFQEIANFLGVRGRALRNVREAKVAFDELASVDAESEYDPHLWVQAEHAHLRGENDRLREENDARRSQLGLLRAAARMTVHTSTEDFSVKLATMEAENAYLRKENDGLQEENVKLRYNLGSLRTEVRTVVRTEDSSNASLGRLPTTVGFALYGVATKLAQRLRLGADPNQHDHEGNPCIMVSSLRGKPECTRLLIAAGADISFVHPDLSNLLDIVVIGFFGRDDEPYHEGNYVLTADLLIDAGAPAPVRNWRGERVIGALNMVLNFFGTEGEDASKAEDCRALISLLTGEYWSRYEGRNPFLQCSTADEAMGLLIAGAANTGEDGHVEMTRLRSISPNIRRGIMAVLDQFLVERSVFVEIVLTVARNRGSPLLFGRLTGHESVLQEIADYLGVRGRVLRNVREAKAAFDELDGGEVEHEYAA